MHQRRVSKGHLSVPLYYTCKLVSKRNFGGGICSHLGDGVYALSALLIRHDALATVFVNTSFHLAASSFPADNTRFPCSSLLTMASILSPGTLACPIDRVAILLSSLADAPIHGGPKQMLFRTETSASLHRRPPTRGPLRGSFPSWHCIGGYASDGFGLIQAPSPVKGRVLATKKQGCEARQEKTEGPEKEKSARRTS